MKTDKENQNIVILNLIKQFEQMKKLLLLVASLSVLTIVYGQSVNVNIDKPLVYATAAAAMFNTSFDLGDGDHETGTGRLAVIGVSWRKQIQFGLAIAPFQYGEENGYKVGGIIEKVFHVGRTKNVMIPIGVAGFYNYGTEAGISETSFESSLVSGFWVKVDDRLGVGLTALLSLSWELPNNEFNLSVGPSIRYYGISD